jgi:hypothetical protein
MHISHTIRPHHTQADPIKITLTLLPTHSAVVRLQTTVSVRCFFGCTHPVPVNQTVVVTSRAPKPLLDACEGMIRYQAQARVDMANLLIGMALTEWIDPCIAPVDDSPEIAEEEAD